MRFREVEKVIVDDGWIFKNAKGSLHHYVHPVKPGKVAIPNHGGDIDNRTVKMIMKQAGLQWPPV